jgi:hypothetical protein
MKFESQNIYSSLLPLDRLFLYLPCSIFESNLSCRIWVCLQYTTCCTINAFLMPNVFVLSLILFNVQSHIYLILDYAERNFCFMFYPLSHTVTLQSYVLGVTVAMYIQYFSPCHTERFPHIMNGKHRKWHFLELL